MTVFIEEEAEDVVPADGWASIVAANHETAHELLARQMAEYEANGGKVTVLEPGASGVEYGWGMVSVMRVAPEPEVERLHTRDQSKKRMNTEARDKALIAAITIELEKGPLKTSHITKALNCSDDLLQRILREHFPDDQRADHLRRAGRDTAAEAARTQAAVQKIYDAIAAGIVGYAPIGRHCHMDPSRVKQLDSLYHIGVPKGRPGSKPGGGQSGFAIMWAKRREAKA